VVYHTDMKTIEQSLEILEKLRDAWATQSRFLESISNNSEDLASTITKAQNRVLAECNSDLYRAIEEIKETF